MSGPFDWEQADKAIAEQLRRQERTIVLDDGQVLTEAMQSKDGNWWVGDSEYDAAQIICVIPLRLYVKSNRIVAEEY